MKFIVKRTTFDRTSIWLRLLPILLVPLIIPATPGAVSAGILPEDLCSGDPCIITDDTNLDVGGFLSLDFEDTDVVLEAQLDGGETFLEITAGSFEIRGDGQILGTALAIHTEDDMTLNGTRDLGTIRIVSEFGDLTLTSASGSIRGNGKVILRPTGPDDDGGLVSILAAADVDLADIEVPGGLAAAGGEIDIDAEGDVTVGDIDLNGGEFGGGELIISCGGSATLSAISVDGRGEFSDAGSIFIDAGDDITFTDSVNGRGSPDSADNCGEGGVIEVDTDESIIISAAMDFRARSGDCCGGLAQMTAGAATIDADLLFNGTGPDGCGGLLLLSVDEDFTCSTLFDLSGQDIGGELAMESLGSFTVGENCELDTSGPISHINLQASDTMQIDGSLIAGAADAARTGAPNGFATAVIELRGCPIAVGSDGSLQSLGSGARNQLTSFSHIQIEGSLVATGDNVLSYPTGFSAEISGTVNPPPTINEDDTLTPCVDPPTPAPTNTSAPVPTDTPEPPPTETIGLPMTNTPSNTDTPVAATPTPTLTPDAGTPTETPTAGACIQPCFGDCDGNCSVAINELIQAVQISLEEAPLERCEAADRNGDLKISIAELIGAVNNALDGCPE